MTKEDTPVARAYRALTDLARAEGRSESRFFALTWLAAGRMVATGTAPKNTTVDQLAKSEAWGHLVESGFPLGALDVVPMNRSSTTAQELRLRALAASIVAELHRELGTYPWDVLPSLVAHSGRKEFDGVDMLLEPELVALLLDLVGEPDGSELWIPFDFSGQLTIEALRRGWRVQAASPMSVLSVMAQLLMTIEFGHPNDNKVRREVDRDLAGRPVGKANYALVKPPFGLSVKGSRLSMWDTSGGLSLDQYARSESWAIHEFMNRTNRRAVFVAPQGVLFAKGQEQRLREYLLNRGGECTELESVIALPPGVFSAATIAGAVLVLNPGGHTDAIRMVDLGSGRRSLLEAGETVGAGRDLALGRTETDKARYVSRAEIEQNEYSFAPSRYLRRVTDLGATAKPLGDICAALRPPTTVKESTPYEVAEVGLQDLTQWRPLNECIDKTVYLKGASVDSARLQPGDIVITIKGTVGKAALMGEAVLQRPTVVSQSCLALRVKSEKVNAQYLLMYLRSPHGQAQLEGLQVGAGVKHISPSTLLNIFQVPVPTVEEQHAACMDFERLCFLEQEVEQLQHEISKVASQRWPARAL